LPRKRRNAITAIEEDPFAPPADEKELMAQYLRQYRSHEIKEEDVISCHSLPSTVLKDDSSSISSDSSDSSESTCLPVQQKKRFIIRIPKHRLHYAIPK